MRHGVKKIKFSKGRDSHQALVRTLLTSFITHGSMDTTLSRAKALKSVIDKLTFKAMRNSQADMNVLLKWIGNKKVVLNLVNNVAPQFKGRVSGFVTIQKLGVRQGDFSETARIKWVSGENIEAKIGVTEKPVEEDKKVQKVEKAVKKPSEKGTKTVKAKKAVTK